MNYTQLTTKPKNQNSKHFEKIILINKTTIQWNSQLSNENFIFISYKNI